MMTTQDRITSYTSGSTTRYDDDVNLKVIFSLLWQGKWLIVISTIIFASGAIFYAQNIPNIYKSDVLLAATENSGQTGLSNITAQFGGLASLAGINLKNRGSSDVELAIQVLKSRRFIDVFIKKHELLIPLMATKGWDLANNTLIYDEKKYNERNGVWLRKPQGLRGSKPTEQEAYQRFIKNVIQVNQDKESSLYRISVSYYSPYVAQKWATWLVDDINSVMRERAIAESKKNLDYLNSQLEKTAIADMRSTFYKLIEEQTKSLMLAEVQEEFIFKVVDPAIAPELKVTPKRTMIAILGLIVGVVFGVVIVLAKSVLRKK